MYLCNQYRYKYNLSRNFICQLKRNEAHKQKITLFGLDNMVISIRELLSKVESFEHFCVVHLSIVIHVCALKKVLDVGPRVAAV